MDQTPTKQKTKWTLLKVLAVAIGGCFLISVFAAVINPSSGTSASDAPSTYEYQLSARAFSESYIERLLKAPSTAEFCRGSATDLGDNRWRVVSCVDSQNSYGAMIRSDWETTLLYSGGDVADANNWKLEKVVFDGKTVYGSDQ